MAWLHHGCGCGFEATLLEGSGGGGLRKRVTVWWAAALHAILCDGVGVGTIRTTIP